MGASERERERERERQKGREPARRSVGWRRRLGATVSRPYPAVPPVSELRFTVLGIEFMVWDLEFRVEGRRFGFGFFVWGCGIKTKD